MLDHQTRECLQRDRGAGAKRLQHARGQRPVRLGQLDHVSAAHVPRRDRILVDPKPRELEGRAHRHGQFGAQGHAIVPAAGARRRSEPRPQTLDGEDGDLARCDLCDAPGGARRVAGNRLGRLEQETRDPSLPVERDRDRHQGPLETHHAFGTLHTRGDEDAEVGHETVHDRVHLPGGNGGEEIRSEPGGLGRTFGEQADDGGLGIDGLPLLRTDDADARRRPAWIE